MGFQESFQSVISLVEDFKSNENHYLNSSYSEADVRNDFINKFFIALGWDVRHEQQKNPYAQEVRVEKPVLIAKAQKKADYTFYLSPNFHDVKFFVEAKKPSHDLMNKDYFFQTIRYGWNARTPIAVLTDFEELIVLDCRFRPDSILNEILSYKIRSYHYTDYADEEKFKEIYFLFSREAVAENSIEKFADALPKPKGKKKALVKETYQNIDEAFLEELDEIRNKLAKSFKKNNEHLTSEELTEATQRTIDRLVFIKFLEDKMIEPHHYISEFVVPHPVSLSLPRKGKVGEVSAWEKFLRASRTLDAKYNGVVFKKSIIDARNIVEPDEKTFTSICEELSYDSTPYNFDAIPIHILGSIYERFLGKVVHATDKRVTIEEKPEVRKAGGVYYTPQYIVDYIVDNTVVKLIEGETPKEISKMRFADIACGSGSFLITVYERLIDYHKKWYQQNTEQAKKDGCIFYEGAYRLSLKQKQEILLNNIYGVDLDQQAVEVTQLSLYLKLLEDETTATANDTWVLFKEKLLPDLNKNIVCGNSLIGTDILTGQTSLPLGGIEGGANELKLKPMNFEDVFPEVIKAGGFDVIVGNPPWIDIKGMNPVEVDYYFEKYKSTSNRMNIYATFFEKALRLLSNNGYFGYIVPNSILYQSSYKELRRIVLNKFHLNNIVRLPDNVFKNVKVESVVLIISRGETKALDCLIYDRQNSINVIDNSLAKEIKKINQDKWRAHELLTFDIFSNDDVVSLITKIEKDKTTLEQICDFSLGITPYDKYKGHSKKLIENREYHSTYKKNKSFKELLAGGDVERYFVNWGGYEYLTYGDWLGAPREKRFFTLPRILVRQIVSGNPLRIYAGYTDEELYNTQTIFNILIKPNIDYKIKFILAILNSMLINFYHAYKYLDLSKNLFQKILIQNCKKFPVPKIESANEKIVNTIVEAVEQMLTAKKQLHEAKTESDTSYLERKCATLDKQIDELVYQLYELTEEEIKIVEDSKSQ